MRQATDASVQYGFAAQNEEVRRDCAQRESMGEKQNVTLSPAGSTEMLYYKETLCSYQETIIHHYDSYYHISLMEMRLQK